MPNGKPVSLINACVHPSAGFSTKSMATIALTPMAMAMMPTVNMMQLTSRFGSWQNQNASRANTASNRSIREPNTSAKGSCSSTLAEIFRNTIIWITMSIVYRHMHDCPRVSRRVPSLNTNGTAWNAGAPKLLRALSTTPVPQTSTPHK